MQIKWLALLLIFVFGAIIGSFLNVCIYRIPAVLSIIRPKSRCPQCSAEIAWRQNIPLLSWMFLRGRCAQCSAPIPARYPLVEALTGLLFCLFFYRFGIHPVTPVVLFLVAVLVVVSFIDIDHQIIPDVISLPGIGVGFLCSFLVPWVAWYESLAGVLLGAGSLLSIALVYEWITKKEGMGFGDVKLLAMLGAFLGWTSIFPTIFIGSVLGSVVGIPLMILRRADSKLALPFGPFLSAGALLYLFFVERFDPLMHWYGESLAYFLQNLF